MGQVSSIFGGVGTRGNQRSSSNNSALLEASMNGDLDLVKELVGGQIHASKTARDVVNESDSAGNAAIHGAVYGNHMNVLKYLIESCNADCLSRNGIGCSPLWLAAGYGHADIFQYLLDYIMKENDKKTYLEALNATNSTGDTPLIAAASRGHTNVIDIIFHHVEGIKDDNLSMLQQILIFENKSGDTALSVATGIGHIGTVEVLLQWSKKVDGNIIDKKNSNGLTPLLIACERGHEGIAHTLVREGACPIRDKNGASPLAVAAFCGCIDVAQKLLDIDFGKALIDVPDDSGGSTPLWLAARTGNKKMVELLLKYGANQTIRNKDGLTPYEAASKYDKQQVIEVFEQIASTSASEQKQTF